MNPQNEKQALVDQLLAKNLGFKPPFPICLIRHCYVRCRISCFVAGPLAPQ